MTSSITINLVTERPDGAFVIVLVEEGEWPSDAIDSELRRLQDRLYSAVDVVVDGHLVSKYPEAMGRPFVIRLDCYDVPREPVEKYFRRFSEHIKTRSDIDAQMRRQGFATSLEFEFNWRRLADRRN